MINYLKKFNDLPEDLKKSVSAPERIALMDEIGKKYGVSLASVVMRVMIKDISILDLPKYFVFEFDIDGRAAEKLTDELKETIFADSADYLGFILDKEEKKEKNIIPENIKKEQEAEDVKISDMAVRGSNFFFSPEDEEEVRELTKKLEFFDRKKDIKEDLSPKIEYIVEGADISFSSEDMKSRFRQLIETYLKGVRNKVETRQALEKDVISGGLGMDSDTVSNIISLADKAKEKESEKLKTAPAKNIGMDKENKNEEKIPENQDPADRGGTVLPEIMKGGRDAGYDFSKLIREKKEAQEKNNITDQAGQPSPDSAHDKNLPQEDEKKKEAIQAVPAKEKPAEGQMPSAEEKEKKEFPIKVEEKKEEVSGIRKKPEEQWPDKQDAVPQSKINIAMARNAAATEGKVKMEDVKFVPKLTGPLEEMKDMSLINFRRLSTVPEEAADKIRSKIKFLEEDGYAKRLAGIKAWRQSPVNKLYLEIGQESMNSRIGIEAVIEKRKQEEKDYITKEEFSAIMDMNKDLRY